MLLNWKNQYCQNDSTTPGNLQIQHNLYQITNGLFFFLTKLEQKISKIYIETHKTPYSQRNPKKEKQRWRNQAP